MFLKAFKKSADDEKNSMQKRYVDYILMALRHLMVRLHAFCAWEWFESIGARYVVIGRLLCLQQVTNLHFLNSTSIQGGYFITQDIHIRNHLTYTLLF